MKTLEKMIANQDWYYQYSDDHRVYSKGESDFMHLDALRKKLSCPYSMAELQDYAFQKSKKSEEIKNWLLKNDQ